MTTTIQKWGNSQGVRIPKIILDTVNWAEEEQIMIVVDNGKSIAVASEDGNSSSALSANTDGTITATVKVGEETTTEQVAYVSDIDKKVTNVLGGEY